MDDLTFTESDKEFVENYVREREGSSVIGKVVCLEEDSCEFVTNFPQNKDDVAYHLAIALGDENSLGWYKKISRERRRDLLKNCLRETLVAYGEGAIKKTKAAYFCGVLKNKTAEQNRLQDYKDRRKIQRSMVINENKNDL